MLRVGLTGGLGCGKSFVATELERLGCHLIRADSLGHQVLALDGPAYASVIEAFGPTIVRPDREIDRARLAAMVFDDPVRLAELNAIVHPAVRRLENELFAGIAERDPKSIAVLEAAILIENGTHRDYDKLIVVLCNPQLQIVRALERDPQADSAIVLARIERQIPVLDKRRYADFLIDTNGTKEDTLAQTAELFARLRLLAQ